MLVLLYIDLCLVVVVVVLLVVSLLDLYPTLCDLSDIELPVHLDGKSLKPILKHTNKEVNHYMFSRWKNGESVKYKEYLYTEYFDTKTGEYRSNMLYNHTVDPNETVNIAGVDKYHNIVEKLKSVLDKHIKTRNK